jgi:hypothetical protein
MPRRSSDICASPLAPCRVSRQVTAPATTRFPKKTEEQTKQRREIQIGYLPHKKTNKENQFHVVTFEPVSGWPRQPAWVLGDQTKNGKALAVPLNDKAMSTLEGQLGKDPHWVFARRRAPVHQTSTRTWYEAVARAGLDDFCWHDLRHTWASWHVQNGTPLHVLQELGGWSSFRMVQRYAHLSSEHLRAWVERPGLALVVDNDRCGTATEAGAAS